jgi:hypothetical protein
MAISMRNRHHNRKNTAVAIGAVLIVFALIGVVATGIFIKNTAATIIDNRTEKQRYAKIIEPMVLFDPPAFASVEKADKNVLRNIGFYACLLEAGEDAPSDDKGQLMIPATDVEARAQKLFGQKVAMTHGNIVDRDMTYTYSDADQSYHVPPTGHFATYQPQVDKIEKKGDAVTLTVSYLPVDAVWQQDENGNAIKPEADKQVKVILTGKKGSETIVSLTDAGQQS